MEVETSSPASFRTNGSRRSEGLRVSQIHGMPAMSYLTNMPRISDLDRRRSPKESAHSRNCQPPGPPSCSLASESETLAMLSTKV